MPRSTSPKESEHLETSIASLLNQWASSLTGLACQHFSSGYPTRPSVRAKRLPFCSPKPRSHFVTGGTLRRKLLLSEPAVAENDRLRIGL